MCRPVRCECGLITWAGCGDHIDSVKAQVPHEQWCPVGEGNAHPAETTYAAN